MWKAVGVTATAFAAMYTYNIGEQRKFPAEKHVDFAVGSAEERMKWRLKTGDVVMFRRQWHSCHIPAALLIAVYRRVFRAEFDHCGVVVEGKLGDYFIYENCMFRGPQLRPFDARLIRSLSQRVEAVHLRPMDVTLTGDQRERLLADCRRKCLGGGGGGSEAGEGECEAVGMLRGLMVHVARSVLGGRDGVDNADISRGGGGLGAKYVCPSVRLVVDVLQDMEAAAEGAVNGEDLDTPGTGAKPAACGEGGDDVFSGMSLAQVQSGEFFDNVAFYMFKKRRQKGDAAAIRSRGQGLNVHVVFR